MFIYIIFLFCIVVVFVVVFIVVVIFRFYVLYLIKAMQFGTQTCHTNFDTLLTSKFKSLTAGGLTGAWGCGWSTPAWCGSTSRSRSAVRTGRGAPQPPSVDLLCWRSRVLPLFVSMVFQPAFPSAFFLQLYARRKTLGRPYDGAGVRKKIWVGCVDPRRGGVGQARGNSRMGGFLWFFLGVKLGTQSWSQPPLSPGGLPR